MSKNDFHLIQYFSSKPNFITSQKISEEIIILKHTSQKKFNLNKKIVVIENADPGYDWIFSQQILGLITKNGGVNSHMSIRCLELGIPSIIGVGENNFETIKQANKIYIDCKNQLYKIHISNTYI